MLILRPQDSAVVTYHMVRIKECKKSVDFYIHIYFFYFPEIKALAHLITIARNVNPIWKEKWKLNAHFNIYFGQDAWDAAGKLVILILSVVNKMGIESNYCLGKVQCLEEIR